MTLLVVTLLAAVRVVLVLEPIAWTSLYSRAHFWLLSAGGPLGRNWSAESRLKGSIRARCWPTGGVGAVGIQAPGTGGLGAT